MLVVSPLVVSPVPAVLATVPDSSAHAQWLARWRLRYDAVLVVGSPLQQRGEYEAHDEAEKSRRSYRRHGTLYADIRLRRLCACPRPPRTQTTHTQQRASVRALPATLGLTRISPANGRPGC